MRQKHRKHIGVRKSKVVQNTSSAILCTQKKNGLGMKLEIAEGLETTTKFFVVSTNLNPSGFEF